LDLPAARQWPFCEGVKESLKYVATIFVFIGVAFGLSWAAVFGYWFAARVLHSVAAIRVCDAIGGVILLPVRAAFWAMGDLFDQSVPLSSPMTYVIINAGLLGMLAYSCCRRWIFPPP
jgi:hypothetical protein